MKLIKINTDHYIIVDDSEIKEGDWFYNPFFKEIGINYNPDGCKKIEFSTQPLECDKMWTPVNGKQWMCNTMLCCGKIMNPKAKPVSIQEVKELIGEVDVEKKAEKFIGCEYDDIEDSIGQIGYDSFIRGYNQALEDNKDRKYTEEDLMKFYKYVKTHTVNEALRYIQPKTEWEVEMVDGKLKLI